MTGPSEPDGTDSARGWGGGAWQQPAGVSGLSVAVSSPGRMIDVAAAECVGSAGLAKRSRSSSPAQRGAGGLRCQ